MALAKQIIEEEALVPVQIAYTVTKLIRMVKTLGGRWDPEARLWYIPHGKIKGTEMEKHIILDANVKHKNRESI